LTQLAKAKLDEFFLQVTDHFLPFCSSQTTSLDCIDAVSASLQFFCCSGYRKRTFKNGLWVPSVAQYL
jgi:hypothetical protein